MSHAPRLAHTRLAVAGTVLLVGLCVLGVFISSRRAPGEATARSSISDTATGANAGLAANSSDRNSDRLASGPWSIDSNTTAGPQSSAEALTSAVALLASSGLLSDLPNVVRELSTVQPLGEDSPVDSAFVELVRERSPSSFQIFQELVLDDLTERSLARERGESPAALTGDQARQLALRMVIAAELGRTGAQLSQLQADEVLARSFDALLDPAIDQPDLARIVLESVETRVGREPSREERAMASLTVDQAGGLTAEQQREREMTKAMLQRAMESAARQGRQDSFDDYTRRYLRIRMGDTPEQAAHWRTVEQSEIARLRQMAGRGGD